jgi:hypothetical protein
MPLHIQLIDRDGKPLAGASLVIHFTMKRGATMSTDPMRSDKDGFIRMDGFADKDLAGVMPRQSTFVVTWEGRESSPQPLTRPQPWRDGVKLMRLQLAGPGAGPARDTEEEEPEPLIPARPDSDNGGTLPTPTRKPRRFIVRGQVQSSDGEPVAGLEVRALHIDICDAILLGSEKTGADGRYRITFTAEDFAQSGKRRPDLVVEVHARGEEPEAVSDLIADARDEEVINFAIGDEAWRGPSLFAHIGQSIGPHLKRDPKTGARDFNRLRARDVALLSARTGIPQLDIGFFVRAWRLAQALKLDPADKSRVAAPFFAGLRAGLPATVSELAVVPAALLSRTVGDAALANIIPAANYEAVFVALRNSRGAVAASADADITTLFSRAGISKSTDQTAALNAILDNEAPSERWGGLQRALGNKAANLRAEVEVWSLCAGNSAFAGELQKVTSATGGEGLAQVDVATIEQVALSKSDLVPAHIPGVTERERAGNYARMIRGNAELRHPQSSFLADIRRTGPADLVKAAEEQLETKASSSRRAGNVPDVSGLFSAAPAVGRGDAVTRLWENDYRNLDDIVQGGRRKFRSGLAVDTTDSDGAKVRQITPEMDKVFDRAVHLRSLGQALAMRDGRALDSGKKKDDGNQPATIRGQLFQGSLGTACTHCESALGPSAYLLDLFRYIERANGDGKTGRDLLDERRPDLVSLKLNCANTDTVMPYIDLVLEVLEDAVAGDTLRIRQTGWITQQLLAEREPGHVNPSAYSKLKAEIFPWRLPHDAEHAQAHALLGKAGFALASLPRAQHVPRQRPETARELLAQLDGATLSLGWACAVLGVSPALAGVNIKGNYKVPQFGGLQTGFFDAGTTLEAIADKLKFTVTEISSMIHTQLVSEGIALLSTDGLALSKAMTAAQLNALQGLGRLMRHLDLSAEEIDLAASHLGSPAQSGLADWLIAYACATETAAHLDMGMEMFWLAFDAIRDGDSQPLAESFAIDPAKMDVLIDQSGLGGLSTAEDLFAFICLLVIVRKSGMDLSLAESLLAPAPLAMFAGISSSQQRADFSASLAEAYAAADVPAPEASNLGGVGMPPNVQSPAEGNAASPSDLLAAALEAVTGVAASAFAAVLPLYPTAPILAIAQATSVATAADIIALSRLTKAALAADAFTMDEAMAGTVSDLSDFSPWPRLSQFPVVSGESWGQMPLASLAALAAHAQIDASTFANTGSSLFALLSDNAGDFGGLLGAIITSTGWDADVAESAAATMGLGTAGDFLAASGIVRMAAYVAICAHYSATPAGIEAMVAQPDPQTAQDWLRMSYPLDATWYPVLQEINDPLREQNRDALLDRILFERAEFADANDVYEHYLLDPKMSACFETSRVVQATAALQQLVQRIQLGLEVADDGKTAVEFEPDDLRQWPWRKNYRVWEANRKVFLYPENWVEPDLRDNKTALFKALEDALLQEDIREETAELAVMDYVRGLHDIANLEVMGLVTDEDNGELHIFARTRELPHKYHWCRRMPNGLWTSWEPIDAEIEGEHFVPVIYHRRPYLFWATTVEKVDSENDDYINAMSSIEADIEDWQSQLNTFRRSVDDLEKAIAEQDAIRTEQVNPLKQIAQILHQFLTDRLDDILPMVTEAEAEIKRLEASKNVLRQKYTFLEFSMNWTAFEKSRGWMPQRKSTNAIATIYEGLSSRVSHYALANTFFFVEEKDDDELTLNLVYRQGGQFTGRGYDKPVFGKFRYDVVNQVMTPIAREDEETVRVEPVANALHAAQRLQIINLDILRGVQLKSGSANDYPTVLGTAPKGSFCIESSFARAYPGEGPVALDMSGRTYLLDPVSAAVPKTLAPQAKAGVQILLPKAQLEATEGKRFSARNFQSSQLFAKKVPGSFQAASFGNQAATVVEGSFQQMPVGQFNNSSVPAAIEGILDADIIEVFPNDRPIKPSPPPSLPGQIASDVKWRFTNLYHPFTALCITELHRFGAKGLYEPDKASGEQNAGWLDRQSRKRRYLQNNFEPTALVENPDILEQFEFIRRSPFAVYNWELFFHTPFLVANQLTRNRKFAEAQKWLHYIFNPIEMDGDGNASAWRLGVFRTEHRNIINGDSPALEDDMAAEFEAQVEEWEANPFNPHAVARLRTMAYMRATFMAYVENILAWADDLFRTDTRESVGEAAQLYVLALQLLGREPVRPVESANPESGKTVAQLLGEQVYFDTSKLGAAGTGINADTRIAGSGFFDLFGGFCLPDNDKLLDYWSTINDRLFKIRHCMNIEGVIRKLPLFQPPIDPALLVRAAAAGLDIGAAVSGLNAPRPHYRFGYMIAKASEFTSEVRSLGASLLSALEKRDAEDLSLIRANHEVTMAERMLDIRKEQVKDAETAIQSIDRAIDATGTRREYYLDLISAGELKEEEKERKRLSEAQGFQILAQSAYGIAGALTVVPTTGFMGFFPMAKFGGIHLSGVPKAVGDASQMIAGQKTFKAGTFARGASKKRRMQDWSFQAQQALIELERLQKDRIGAEIRLAMAQKEVSNQQRAIDNAQQAETFLKGKFTGKQLYGWMVTELSKLHYQAFQLAVELARQAEACYRYEIEGDANSYIGFSNWDSMRKGLLAGERLSMDLRRLEAAYMARNARVFELRKNISLARLNPIALMKLRTGNEANFDLPEFIFNLDHPGHYNRRIKAVSITIPAVAGPQTVIGCELQLNSSIRRTDPQTEPDSTADTQYLGQRIATSGGHNDAGLFQFDFRDERYLPFEGAGAVSNWTLRLPGAGLAQFDHASITDVIIHLHYTAKGDDGLRQSVTSELGGVLPLPDGTDGGEPFAVILSLRSDFAGEWARVSNDDDRTRVSLEIVPEHLPYILCGRSIKIAGVQLHPVTRQPAAFEVNPEAVDVVLGDSATVDAEVETGTGALIRSGEIKDMAVMVYCEQN